MRKIHASEITDAVAKLFYDACMRLPSSLSETIVECEKNERDPLAASVLRKLTENQKEAERLCLPVCQDTGMAVVFLELGQEVYIEGAPLGDAVNEGVRRAYTDGYLRKSVVRDPLFERVNTNDNTPAVLYTTVVPGDKLRITAAPKGFGSENMSAVKMFKPTADAESIVAFVTETVKAAGGNPCPPTVIGVGLGGTFEYAALLAKRALTREVGSHHPDSRYASMEDEICRRINQTGIGPQGFGGDTTCLGVMIETYPTHIAGLPCAVNVGCHVTRHASCIL